MGVLSQSTPMCVCLPCPLTSEEGRRFLPETGGLRVTMWWWELNLESL